MRSPDGVLSWEKCIERLCRFAFNTDGTEVEVVPASAIYMRNPFLRLRRKKGPTTDPKEGQKGRGPSQVTEAEEVDEEETLLTQRERMAAAL